MAIELIKLLNLASPKDLKDTINSIITSTNASNIASLEAKMIALETKAAVESALSTGVSETLVHSTEDTVPQAIEFCTAQDIDNLFN